jgi:uncharacterized membrane protein YukC
MKRFFLWASLGLIAFTIIMLAFFSTLYISSLPDMFVEAKAQQEFSTPAAYQAFVKNEYCALAIQGLTAFIIMLSLVFLFVKITKTLNKFE